VAQALIYAYLYGTSSIILTPPPVEIIAYMMIPLVLFLFATLLFVVFHRDKIIPVIIEHKLKILIFVIIILLIAFFFPKDCGVTSGFGGGYSADCSCIGIKGTFEPMSMGGLGKRDVLCFGIPIEKVCYLEAGSGANRTKTVTEC
jgi:hypothetical protein